MRVILKDVEPDDFILAIRADVSAMHMKNVTPAMRVQLERLVTLRLPPSLLKHSFPGFPATMLDMRAVAGLERRWLVESVVHRWRPYGGTDERPILTYRATEAGRTFAQ